MDCYVSRTLNDILLICELTGVCHTVPYRRKREQLWKKLNSGETLGTTKRKKETNFSDGRVIQVYLAGKVA